MSFHVGESAKTHTDNKASVSAEAVVHHSAIRAIAIARALTSDDGDESDEAEGEREKS